MKSTVCFNFHLPPYDRNPKHLQHLLLWGILILSNLFREQPSANKRIVIKSIQIYCHIHSLNLIKQSNI